MHDRYGSGGCPSDVLFSLPLLVQLAASAAVLSPIVVAVACTARNILRRHRDRYNP